MQIMFTSLLNHLRFVGDFAKHTKVAVAPVLSLSSAGLAVSSELIFNLNPHIIQAH